MSQSYKYFAFISYSRKDSKVAAWLQRRLEWFRFPVKLIPADRRPPHDCYVRPIYRDKTNLEVTHEHYWKNIRQALGESRYLIVLCSPHSAASEPVEMEVAHFLETHDNQSSLVAPVIVSGNVTSRSEDAALCPVLRALGDLLINRNLPTMVPDAVTAEQDAWEAGFVSLISYLLQLDRTAIGDHIQRETRRQARVLRRWISAVAVLASLAVWQSVLARKAERVAVNNAEMVIRNSSRSHFLSGMELLRRDDSAGCLAHLSRAVRIDPANTAAIVRLASLLGQREWPIPLRVFPQEFPVRQLLMHPDARRVVIGSSLDATQVKGALSVQAWDWTTGRLLAPPYNVHRCDLTSLKFSPAGDAYAIERDHKGIRVADVLLMPSPDSQPSLPFNAVRSHELINYHQFLSFSADGQFALLEEHDYLAVRRVRADGADGEPVAFLMPDSYGNLDSLPDGVDKQKTMMLKGLAQTADVLDAHIDGRMLVLLCRDDKLRRIHLDTRAQSVTALSAGKLMPPLLAGCFAAHKPWLAAVGSNQRLQVWNWREQTPLTKSLPLPDEKWARQLEEGGKEMLDFMFDDKAIALKERPGAASESTCWSGEYWLIGPDGDDPSGEWKPFPQDVPDLETRPLILRVSNEQVEVIEPSSLHRICEPLRHESKVTTSARLNDHLFATGTELGMARVWTIIPAQLSIPEKQSRVQSDPLSDEKPSVLLAEADSGWQLYGQGSPRDYKAWLQHGDARIDLSFPLWDGIYAGRFDASGSRLVVCGAQGLAGSTPGALDQGAYVCDVKDGRVISPLLRHDECWWAGFEPGGRRLVTAGSGYIQFWDATTYEPVGLRLQHPNVAWCEWNPHAPHLMLSIQSDGGFRMWDLNTASVRKQTAWPLTDGRPSQPSGPWLTDSISFSAGGDRFVQRYLDQMCVWDTETVEPLIDPVPADNSRLRWTYADALKHLGWDFLSADAGTPSSSTALATLAEATAGVRVEADGATKILAERTDAFRQARERVQEGGPPDNVMKLVQRVLKLPELHSLLNEDAEGVANALASGQALYQLTEAADPIALYDGAENDHGQQMTWALKRNKLEVIRQRFADALRLSPAAAPAGIAALVNAWRDRSDPVGFTTAFHFGARDAGNTARVKQFFAALGANKEDARGEGDVPMQRVLKDFAEWEKEVGLPPQPTSPPTAEPATEPGADNASTKTPVPEAMSSLPDGNEGNPRNAVPFGRASKTAGKVISPFPPYTELEASDMVPGSLLLDPVSQKVFRMP